MIEPPRAASRRQGGAARAARPRQGGIVVLAVLSLLILLGIGFALAQRDLGALAASRARQHSVEALAQARTALIGAAMAYADSRPGQTYGHLPCPRLGPGAAGSCGGAGEAVFGRMPYAAAGLADVRDGWGECLWYAIAATVKPEGDAPLNWDTLGQFDIVAADGRALTDPADPYSRAVAVVFAPGPPLPTQDRPASTGGGCSGSGAAADLPAYLDAGYAATAGGPLTVHLGSADGETNNDQAMWLSLQDVFDALKRRSDFPAFINGIIDRAAVALQQRLEGEEFCAAFAGTPCDGGRHTARLPDAATLGLTGAAATLHDNWRDQFWLVACTGGTPCLSATVDEPSGIRSAAPCTAVLLFGGERVRAAPGRQTRTTAAERADPAQYAEGDNVTSLEGVGSVFSGHAAFVIDNPVEPASGDVIRCLN